MSDSPSPRVRWIVPVVKPQRIEYKPLPVRSLLREIKNTASLMLDLAYYSVLYADKMMAYRVMKLENEIDAKWALTVMQTMMAARTPEDSESLLSIVRIANSLDDVSDAAGDIAYIAIEMYEGLRALAPAILGSEEWVARVRVNRPASPLTVGQVSSYPRHADVVAIVRNQSVIIDPPLDQEIRPGDELILRGTEEALKIIADELGDHIEVSTIPMEALDPASREVLSRASWMKNIADIALDLAFHSVVYNDKESALEVVELEEQVDTRYLSLMRGLGQAQGLSPNEKIALTIMFTSLEKITDAAAQMASLVLSDVPIPEIVQMVEEESNEIIVKAQVGAPLHEKTLEDARLDDVGAHVVAVKTRGGQWIPLPPPHTLLQEGDVILLKLYTEKDESLLKALEKRGLTLIE